MTFTELFIISICLSADAFSAALCKGLSMRRFDLRHTAVVAAFFGGFQALMPLAGWFLGRQFEGYIAGLDHWIAFLLLAFIGIKMARDAFRQDENLIGENLDLREVFLLSIATSIDALAVGVAYSFFLSGGKMLSAAFLIGAVTFVITTFGVLIGAYFGNKYKTAAQLFGGLVLVLIGVRILTDHLN